MILRILVFSKKYNFLNFYYSQTSLSRNLYNTKTFLSRRNISVPSKNLHITKKVHAKHKPLYHEVDFLWRTSIRRNNLRKAPISRIRSQCGWKSNFCKVSEIDDWKIKIFLKKNKDTPENIFDKLIVVENTKNVIKLKNIRQTKIRYFL